jgi:hypothetical protein
MAHTHTHGTAAREADNASYGDAPPGGSSTTSTSANAAAQRASEGEGAAQRSADAGCH